MHNKNIALDVNGKIEITNIVNFNFFNSGSNTQDNIHNGNKNFRHFLSDSVTHNFKLFTTSEIEVLKIINSFDNKFCNINNIPMHSHKSCANVIKYPIKLRFNSCINIVNLHSVVQLSNKVTIQSNQIRDYIIVFLIHRSNVRTLH